MLPDAGELSAEQLLRQRGTLLEAYKHTGGTWLSSAPLLLNEDFDFASALAIPDIGAALAAGKRLQHNRTKAQQLGDVRLSDATTRALDAKRKEGTHVWFVLWGAEQARLMLVADRFAVGMDAPVSHVTVEGADRALASFAVPGRLDEEARALMAELERAAPQSVQQ